MNLDLEIQTCLICGSTRYHIISRKVQGGKKGLTVICKKCGLVYRKLENEKSNNNQNYYERSIQKSHLVEKHIKRGIEILNWINTSTNRYGRKLPFNGRTSVLDIGCGSGGLLKVLKNKYKCQVLGVEADNSMATYAANLLNLRILNERFENVEIEDRFDIIIMSHVIFCFVNPLNVLNKVKRLLAKDGIIYLSIGNYFYPKRYEGLSNYLFKSYVLYYFTPRTISLLLNMSGLKMYAIDAAKKGDIKLLAKNERNSKKSLISTDKDLYDKWWKTVIRLRLYDYKSALWRIIRKTKVYCLNKNLNS
jgi:SAM-dependent methyltransferase